MTRTQYIKSRNNNIQKPINTLYELYNQKYPTHAVKFMQYFQMWVGNPFNTESTVQEIIEEKDKKYNITKMYNQYKLIQIW